MRYARCPASTKESLGWVRSNSAWHRVKTLIHLDSPYNREGQLPRPASPPAFPLRSRTADEHVPLMKRAMDITGSLIALVLFSPLFLGVALAIKLTSSGPVFSRQKRVGQYGVPFVFLKFSSMCVNNAASIHKEYVEKLIAGNTQKHSVGSGKGVYKLTKDPRAGERTKPH
jgi:lipopolysaccharide/colanic/teichoic acid biosynthesis glycosyltransferase